MALSILNNIPSLAAQNQLSITGSSLQKTLFRLSSGSRINSGADDAAGLAIADGLRANVTALTQSARNATDGIGKLQVADGALAQVTTLLNRAVTLATESATGTVSDGQRVALNAEFAQIKSEITRIGSRTTYNGQAIFGSGSSSDPNNWVGATGGLTNASALVDTQTMTITDTDTGKSSTFTASTSTVQGMMDYFNSGAGAANVNVNVSLDTTGHIQVSDKSGNGSIVVTTNIAAYGAVTRASISGGTDVYLSDGTTAGSEPITTTINALAANSIGTGGSKVDLSSNDLLSATNAQSALTKITSAISNVAADRGTLGAAMNRLQSAGNVINNQVQNLSAAEDGIRAADIAQEVANMTKTIRSRTNGVIDNSTAGRRVSSVRSMTMDHGTEVEPGIVSGEIPEFGVTGPAANALNEPRAMPTASDRFRLALIRSPQPSTARSMLLRTIAWLSRSIGKSNSLFRRSENCDPRTRRPQRISSPQKKRFPAHAAASLFRRVCRSSAMRERGSATCSTMIACVFYGVACA